jgi:nucleoside-diphosphate-sugar epimerase
VNLLILGGTRFVGRHLTEAALAAGHQVTLFNRGRTNPDLFLEAEHLHGDRGGDLTALRARRQGVARPPSVVTFSRLNRSPRPGSHPGSWGRLQMDWDRETRRP